MAAPSGARPSSTPPWEDAPVVAAQPVPRAAPLRASPPPALSLPAPSEKSVALANRWHDVARRMAEAGRIVALTRELAWQAGLIGVDEDATPPLWRLRVDSESLRQPALCEKLQAALAAELGEPVAIDIERGVPEDSPLRREMGERNRRQVEAEERIRADPVVIEMLSQFKTARIVPGSIKPIA